MMNSPQFVCWLTIDSLYRNSKLSVIKYYAFNRNLPSQQGRSKGTLKKSHAPSPLGATLKRAQKLRDSIGLKRKIEKILKMMGL